MSKQVALIGASKYMYKGVIYRSVAPKPYLVNDDLAKELLKLRQGGIAGGPIFRLVEAPDHNNATAMEEMGLVDSGAPKTENKAPEAPADEAKSDELEGDGSGLNDPKLDAAKEAAAVDGKTTSLDFNVTDAVDTIKQIESLDALDAFAKEDTRVTVSRAYVKRASELNVEDSDAGGVEV